MYFVRSYDGLEKQFAQLEAAQEFAEKLGDYAEVWDGDPEIDLNASKVTTYPSA